MSTINQLIKNDFVFLYLILYSVYFQLFRYFNHYIMEKVKHDELIEKFMIWINNSPRIGSIAHLVNKHSNLLRKLTVFVIEVEKRICKININSLSYEKCQTFEIVCNFINSFEQLTKSYPKKFEKFVFYNTSINKLMQKVNKHINLSKKMKPEIKLIFNFFVMIKETNTCLAHLDTLVSDNINYEKPNTTAYHNFMLLNKFNLHFYPISYTIHPRPEHNKIFLVLYDIKINSYFMRKGTYRDYPKKIE